MLSVWLARFNEGRIWQRPVSFRGMNFVPPSLDRWVALQAHRFRVMGSSEFKFFENFVQPQSRIADVGANQGLYTLTLAHQASQGRVYAFEPDPQLFAALSKNIQQNRVENVQLFNVAAASKASKLLLRPGQFNRGDNRIVQAGPDRSSGVEVDAMLLDDAIPDRRLDLLKIDVQGFEVEVLRGAEQLLSANPGLLLLLEFWPHGLRLAGSRPEELLDLLGQAGFYLFQQRKDASYEPFIYQAANWSRPDRFGNLAAARDKRLFLANAG